MLNEILLESNFVGKQFFVWAHLAPPSSAGFQTCCIADFQIGSAHKVQRPLGLSGFADLEIRGTADLEVGATGNVRLRPFAE